MLMAVHPGIQKRAQKEIDQLLKGERLPMISDYDDLPYISALIKEMYRWHVPFPYNIPKSLKEDDIYKGYRLPKGATVLEDIWAAFTEVWSCESTPRLTGGGTFTSKSPCHPELFKCPVKPCSEGALN